MWLMYRDFELEIYQLQNYEHEKRHKNSSWEIIAAEKFRVNMTKNKVK